MDQLMREFDYEFLWPYKHPKGLIRRRENGEDNKTILIRLVFLDLMFLVQFFQ